MVDRRILLVCFVSCLVLNGCVAKEQQQEQEQEQEQDFEIDDDAEDSPLSITCMRCLCKVMGCQKDEGCVDNYCGVMHITQGYWEMAHYRTASPDNLAEYQKCANNVWCATRTVQRYMKQYLPACEDKRQDRLRCENAVALHKFGQRRCDRNLTETTETKLLGCLDEKVWKWLEDAEE